jgi:hypothetical protein
VWDTLRCRFAAVVVVQAAGGCAGPVCVWQSRTLDHATYSQLAARFGPRPPGLDTARAAPITVPGWAITLAAALAAAITTAAAATALIILRSRDRRPPTALPPAPGPGPESSLRAKQRGARTTGQLGQQAARIGQRLPPPIGEIGRAIPSVAHVLGGSPATAGAPRPPTRSR